MIEWHCYAHLIVTTFNISSGSTALCQPQTNAVTTEKICGNFFGTLNMGAMNAAVCGE